LVTSAKRLLQQYRHKADLARGNVIGYRQAAQRIDGVR
jgi:hypothetical protein